MTTRRKALGFAATQEDLRHDSFVSDNTDIFFGKFDSFSWIRCVGKGNFLTSPHVKQCAEQCVSHGERCIVIDLGACTGMDSTFMGMLAGLAMRLTKQTGGGRLEIAAANEKNLMSLEDLGLDAFMEINPRGAVWNQSIEHIQSSLTRWTVGTPLDMRERTQFVLEAHKTLSEANEENAKKFETVVNLLEKELGNEHK